jgi:hypothetical protein
MELTVALIYGCICQQALSQGWGMWCRFLLLFFCIVCLNIPAYGAVFTVSTQQEFVAALEGTAINKQDDEIRILYGADIQSLEYEREPGYSLRIVGGFANDFTERVYASSSESSVVAEIHPGIPEPQKSTTGPVPDSSISAKPAAVTSSVIATGGTEVVLGVPGYEWRHGCGPTAVGMVAGYYDMRGYDDLFDGSASSQTDGVNQGIASQHNSSNPGHYEDYSQPIDSSGSLQNDKSEPGEIAHDSDCIADLMRTSWSVDDMRYGWSYSNMIAPSLVSYAALRNPGYSVTTTEYYMSYNPQLTWDVFTGEIDNNRPMVFLVDTNADGSTDHFVTIVGYRDSPSRQYGCLDTWSPASSVRWCNFQPMGSGVSWGVFGGAGFEFAPLDSAVSLAPIYNILLDAIDYSPIEVNAPGPDSSVWRYDSHPPMAWNSSFEGTQVRFELFRNGVSLGEYAGWQDNDGIGMRSTPVDASWPNGDGYRLKMFSDTGILGWSEPFAITENIE